MYYLRKTLGIHGISHCIYNKKIFFNCYNFFTCVNIKLKEKMFSILGIEKHGRNIQRA